MILKKYVIGLGSDNSQLIKGLGQTDAAVQTFVSKAGKLLGGLGIGAGFAKIIKDFTGLGSELKAFSDSTGIAVEDVSRLGLALEQFGGDTAGAAAALEGLQNNIRQAVDWGQGPLIDVMGKYGVAVQNSNGKIKTAAELYSDLADIMKGLNKSQQRDLAQSLGLDESSIRLLQQGRQGVDGLLASRSDLAVMTAEDAEAARNWDLALKDLKQMMTGFGRELARITLPAIQRFAEFGKKIAEEWSKHKDTIDHVANVIKTNLVPAFALAALKIGAAMAPLLLELAPLAAIALLIEDLYVFMQGGNSLLGDLLGDDGDMVREKLTTLFSGWGGILKGLLTGDFRGAFEEAKVLWNEIVVPVFKGLGPLLLDALNFAIFGWQKVLADLIIEWFRRAVDEVVLALKDTKLGKFLNLNNYEPKSEYNKNNPDGTAERRRLGLKEYQNIYQNMQNGAQVPGVQTSTVNNAASSSNNVVINQTFNGQADPDVVSKAAKKGAEKGLPPAPDYSAALAFGQRAY